MKCNEHCELSSAIVMLWISSKSCVLTKTQGKENSGLTFKILILCANNYNVINILDPFTKFSLLLKISFKRQR